MRVSIEGHGYGAVTEQVLDERRVRAASEQERRGGVAQVVPACVRQTRAPEQGFKAAVDDVLGFDGRADGGRENEVRISIEAGPNPLAGEPKAGPLPDRERPRSTRGRRRSASESLDAGQR